MSIVNNFPSIILHKINLLCPLVTNFQTRNYWGNRNNPNPRGANRPNRHWDSHTHKLRKAKIMKIKLPEIDKQRSLQKEAMQDPAVYKEYLKKQGILPTTPESDEERPFYTACTQGAIDTYVPPEGEGKATLTGAGSSVTKWAKQKAVDPLEGKRKTMMAVRSIRNWEPDFDAKTFPLQAEQIYIAAHEALAGKRKKKLLEYATEFAYPNMIYQTKNVSMYWEFIESLEPPQVKQVRIGEILTKDNKFAQVTVRFHTKQILAVYDRFGRLIHGHPHVAKDVIEFVNFEKHIVNIYGKWRLHEKLIPEWLAKTREPGTITHILEKDYYDEVKEEVHRNTEDDDTEEDVILDKYGKPIREKK